jgi:hypothetical protein
LWIQIEDESAAHHFQLRIADSEGRTAASLDGLEKNRYGALSVTIPAASLPAGSYTVHLYRKDPHVLLAQYLLKVTSR